MDYKGYEFDCDRMQQYRYAALRVEMAKYMVNKVLD